MSIPTKLLCCISVALSFFVNSAHGYQTIPDNFNGLKLESKPTTNLKLIEKNDIKDIGTDCKFSLYEQPIATDVNFYSISISKVSLRYCNNFLDSISLRVADVKFGDALKRLTDIFGKPSSANMNVSNKCHIWRGQNRNGIMLTETNNVISITIEKGL